MASMRQHSDRSSPAISLTRERSKESPFAPVPSFPFPEDGSAGASPEPEALAPSEAAPSSAAGEDTVAAATPAAPLFQAMQPRQQQASDNTALSTGDARAGSATGTAKAASGKQPNCPASVQQRITQWEAKQAPRFAARPAAQKDPLPAAVPAAELPRPPEYPGAAPRPSSAPGRRAAPQAAGEECDDCAAPPSQAAPQAKRASVEEPPVPPAARLPATALPRSPNGPQRAQLPSKGPPDPQEHQRAAPMQGESASKQDKPQEGRSPGRTRAGLGAASPAGAS